MSDDLDCTAEFIKNEHNHLRVQQLYNLNDPNYTHFTPKIDPNADAYTVLVPCITNYVLFGTTINLYIPVYIETLTFIEINSYKYITIDLCDQPIDTPPIEIILEECKNLPTQEDTLLQKNFKRVRLSLPGMRLENVYLYSEENYLFYAERIYYKDKRYYLIQRVIYIDKNAIIHYSYLDMYIKCNGRINNTLVQKDASEELHALMYTIRYHGILVKLIDYCLCTTFI